MVSRCGAYRPASGGPVSATAGYHAASCCRVAVAERASMAPILPETYKLSIEFTICKRDSQAARFRHGGCASGGIPRNWLRGDKRKLKQADQSSFPLSPAPLPQGERGTISGLG